MKRLSFQRCELTIWFNYVINCCYYFVSRYSPKNRFAQKMCYAEIEEPGSYLYL